MDKVQHTISRGSWAPVQGVRGVLLGSTCVGMLLLYVVAVWWGTLNQDEGWYLYAGRLVAEGRVPYRDFASTQGPVMAYVYAAAYPLVQAGGVLAGRLFTALLGLMAVGLAAYLARIMAMRRGQDPYWPVLFVVGLLGLNLYQVYFTSIVKTYALAAVFMLTGLVLLERALAAAQQQITKSGYAVMLQAGLGGFALAMAAGVRLSAAFVLSACWLPVAVRWFQLQRPRRLGHWLAGLLLGGTLGMVLLFGPFILVAPDAVRFGLLQYHAGRSLDSWITLLVYKGGFVLRLCQAYWPLLAAGILTALFVSDKSRPDRAYQDKTDVVLPLWTSFAVVTIVHLLSAFPYDDYQVFIVPAAAIAVSLRAGVLFEKWDIFPPFRIRWAAGLILVLFLFGLSSGLLQEWLLAPRDRIWWPLRSHSSLAQLRQVGAALREGRSRDAIDGIILTQDTYLAVETGFRVPDGMEMGPFSNFLTMPDMDAARLKVLNRAGLIDRLRHADGQWAAYSAYGFSIMAPTIRPISTDAREHFLSLVEERFALFDVVPAFGQAMTDLRIYKRKRP